MKNIIFSLLIGLSATSFAVTDKNMKMKMEFDKTNPNIIVINIVPESQEEYERLKEIIEKKENQEISVSVLNPLPEKEKKSDLKEEKNQGGKNE